MKVLHVITSLLIGGAEKLMLDLLPGLKKEGHDVDLCVFKGVKTSLYDEIEKRGVKVIALGKKSVYNPMYILELVKLMHKYDIVHTHNTAAQLFCAIANLLCPKTILITTEHTTSNRRRNWRGYYFVDRWMYSRYNTIICCAEKVRDSLTSYIKLTCPKSITINNGIDVDKFILASPSDYFRKNLPGDVKIITMVGGFRWEKDQDTIIRGVSFLESKFHLVLVGDGVRRPTLENLAKDLNVYERVHFLGIRNDIPELLKASDFIVMSSHFEGLSLSSIEGMAAGRPMIASNVDGLMQVVGGAGVLFEHSTPEDFAEKISMLYEDSNLYQEVSKQCLERAKQYDICNMVRGYIAVYKKCFEKNK